MAFGITDNGFVRKTLQDIKTSLENKWKDPSTGFGANSDLSEDSPNSILIGIMASGLDPAWQQLENSHNSLNPNAATGVSLDNDSNLTGIQRKDESKTVVSTSFKGTNGLIITANSQFSQSSTGNVFENLEQILLSQYEINSIDLQIDTVLDLTTYTVVINSASYFYTSDASATVDEIINGLKAVIEAAAIGLSVTNNGDSTFTIEADDLSDTYNVVEGTNISILKVQSIGELTALEYGQIEATANSVDTIDTPISGLDSVFNHIDGEAGSEIEADSALRQRRERDITVAGFNFTDAIRSKLIDNVDGVSFARVYENDTLSIVNDIDPKSIEAVVEGGSSSDIAEQLFQLKVGGISTSGNTTINYPDSQGVTHAVKFSRSENTYIWVKVTINSYNTEETFPSNGSDAIKTAVYDYGIDTFSIGDDIILQKFYNPVYSIPGLGDVTIQIAETVNPTDVPSYGSANISVDIRTIGNFSESRVEVVL